MKFNISVVNLLFLCLYSFLISPVSKYSSTHLCIDDLLQSNNNETYTFNF